MKYYIIAGEASGDLHGSNLMRELKQIDVNAEFRFWGGDLMTAQGKNLVRHYQDTAIIGFWEVMKKLRTIFRNLKFCKSDITDYNPDVVILIDYPGFNFRIAEFAKSKGFRVFYYIAPKVWAWKESRANKLRRYVDKLFVIFPFEIDYFKRRNINACYEGNPLIDSINKCLSNKKSFDDFVKYNDLRDKPIIAVLAGSRKQEIDYILPRVKKLVNDFPQYQFVLAAAPSIDGNLYKKYLPNYEMATVYGQTYETLMHCSAAIVASGTATLEAALLGAPQAVCYGGSELSYQIGKRLIKVKYISLVNLIMNKAVVKELIQHDMTVEKMKAELSGLLFDVARRRQIMDDYAELTGMLGSQGTSYRIAKAMIDEINKMKIKNVSNT
ncbi:MAG: lipid-A-disaccharide synthase [Prevotellaceae bacterium]|jgi:lipid-A-disaccharide synthase|nr:lipid-A-disaccharide synthase [Prevotellaceae bacterium]